LLAAKKSREVVAFPAAQKIYIRELVKGIGT